MTKAMATNRPANDKNLTKRSMTHSPRIKVRPKAFGFSWAGLLTVPTSMQSGDRAGLLQEKWGPWGVEGIAPVGHSHRHPLSRLLRARLFTKRRSPCAWVSCVKSSARRKRFSDKTLRHQECGRQRVSMGTSVPLASSVCQWESPSDPASRGRLHLPVAHRRRAETRLAHRQQLVDRLASCSSLRTPCLAPVAGQCPAIQFSHNHE